MSVFSLRALLASAAIALALPAGAAPTVELETSLGNIVIELNAEKAPKTVANFMQYTHDGFYNGTVFHRVMPNFMIQGGGFEPGMRQKPTREEIPLESTNGLKNVRGSVAMARRTPPHSATAQFFINHVDNGMLDFSQQNGPGYAVFGKVTRGMDVVDRIAQVPTGNAGPHQNVPLTPVVIKNVKIISEK